MIRNDRQLTTRYVWKGVSHLLRTPRSALRTLVLVCLVLHPMAAWAQSRPGYQFVATFDYDEKLKGQLERLKQLEAQKAWEEWVTLYQHLIEERPDGVVPRGPETFVGLRAHLEQQFAQTPPEVRQRYRNRYDPAAKQLWDQAKAAADAPTMRRLYNRYRPSSYAQRALLWLANRDLDHGEFELARLAFARLARDPEIPAAEAPWVLLKWALCAAEVGRRSEVTEALDQLERGHAGREMRVGGRTMVGAEVARRYRRDLLPADVRPTPGADAAEPLDWPMFAGIRGDRRMTGTITGPLQLVWQLGLSTNSAAASVPYERGGWRYRSMGPGPFSQLSLPVTLGGNLFVQSATSVQCVRISDGKVLWTAKEPFEMNLPRPLSSRVSPSYRLPRSLQGAPVATRGRVFVRMPVGSMDSYSGTRWPADYALAALDARTGEPVWLRLAGGSPTGTYYNLPTRRGNTLYTGVATLVAGLTEYRAAAVDAGSGENRWTAYLGTGTDPMTITDGSPPAVRDGIVWIESSLHTLNALDALTGDILWIYRYEPRPTPYYRSGWQDTLTQVNEPVSLIAVAGARVLAPGQREADAPAGTGARVYFAPRWGEDCVALDGRTGRVLWSAPKGESRTLCGMDGERVYLCGDEVRALDLATGARRWGWEAPDSYSGLAALAGDRLYVPVGPVIYVLDAATGRELEQLDLRRHEVEPGYGAVTILGTRLYLSQGERLIAFEKQEP